MVKSSNVLIEYSFENFKVGDYVVFKKTFTREHYKSFEKLSGDSNRLHSDFEFGKLSKFKDNIVPLHLSISPLSSIAGMIFPGEPSLYLGHEVIASFPVFFDQELTYSSKIVHINKASRIITIRVLVIQNLNVLLDAKMKVQCLEDKWFIDKSEIQKISNSENKAYALITGSSGDIGKSIALELAKNGWNLILHVRKDDSRKLALEKLLSNYNIKYEFIISDLESLDGIEIISRTVRSKSIDLGLIVHSASSQVDSNIDDLISTNYKSLKSICESALNGFLMRQNGIIIFISSISILNNIIGWEDYSSVKAMTTSYVSGLNKNFNRFGIRSMSILPNVVKTKFSEKFSENDLKLLPEEVAHEVNMMIESKSDISRIIELTGRKDIIFGVHELKKNDNSSLNIYEEKIEKNKINLKVQNIDNKSNIKNRVYNIILKILKLSSYDDLLDGGLGSTKGWDSLSQIFIIVAIEEDFNIHFTSQDLFELTSINKIIESISRKLE